MNNELFETRRKKPVHKAPKYIYDVKVTWNSYTEKESGRKVDTIRFAFHNKAAKIFEPGKHIQVSRVDSGNPELKNAIYFMVDDIKRDRDFIKIQATSKGLNRRSSSVTITPNDNEKKIFRCRWINKAYELQFDSAKNLFFISQSKTVGNIAPEGDEE